jgi:hypothetical protein
MSACVPTGFHLDTAAHTTGMDLDQARDIAAALMAQARIMELDQNGPRLLAQRACREEPWVWRHAMAMAERFDVQFWTTSDLTAYWPDLEYALDWALTRTDDPRDWALACKLASRGVRWARAQERLAEAFEILQAWSQAATRQGDRRVLEDCAWEQIWILEHWGRSHEARRLDGLRRREFADQMPLDFGGEFEAGK